MRAVRQRVQQGCHKGIDKTCRPRDAFELAQQPSMRALCRYAVHYGEWRQRWGRWEEEEEEKEEEGLGGGGPLPLLLLLLFLLLKLLFSSSMGFLFLLLRRSCPSLKLAGGGDFVCCKRGLITCWHTCAARILLRTVPPPARVGVWGWGV